MIKNIKRLSKRQSAKKSRLEETSTKIESVTNITQVNVCPTPQNLMETLSNCRHTKETAILDLLDNSIDAGATHISLKSIAGNEVFPPEPIPTKLLVIDDGMGMSYDDIRMCLQVGDSKCKHSTEDNLKLGKFGIGFIQSIGTLIGMDNDNSHSNIRIITKQKGNVDIISTEFNFKGDASYDVDIKKNSDEDVNIFKNNIMKHRDFKKTHGTLLMIDLDILCFPNGTKDWFKKLHHEIGLTFEHFIYNKKCKFSIEGKDVRPIDPIERGNKYTETFFAAVDKYGKHYPKKVYLTDKSNEHLHASVTFVLLSSPEKVTIDGKKINKPGTYHAKNMYLPHSHEYQGLYIRRNGRLTYRSDGTCPFFKKIFGVVKHADYVRMRVIIDYNSKHMDKYMQVDNTKTEYKYIDEQLLKNLKDKLSEPLKNARSADIRRKTKNNIGQTEEVFNGLTKNTNVWMNKLQFPKQIKLSTNKLRKNDEIVSFKSTDDKLNINYNTSHTHSISILSSSKKVKTKMLIHDVVTAITVNEMFEQFKEKINNTDYIRKNMTLENFSICYNKVLEEITKHDQRKG